MATKLFINRTDLVRNSIMDGNINTDKFIQFIKLAQETDIELPANAKFKTLSVEYLQPMLIWFAQSEYYPSAAYQIRNGGVFKHKSENSETVSKEEIDFLVEKARTNAEWYSRRFIDYMAFNQAQFPKYNQNTDSDIYPSQDATFNGWVL